MADTMLEKMARGIYPMMAVAHDFNAIGFLDFDAETAEDPDSWVVEQCYEAARAALMAIRVPDRLVQVAGVICGARHDGAQLSHEGAGEVFTAMIDAILSGEA